MTIAHLVITDVGSTSRSRKEESPFRNSILASPSPAAPEKFRRLLEKSPLPRLKSMSVTVCCRPLPTGVLAPFQLTPFRLLYRTMPTPGSALHRTFFSRSSVKSPPFCLDRSWPSSRRAGIEASQGKEHLPKPGTPDRA